MSEHEPFPEDADDVDWPDEDEGRTFCEVCGADLVVDLCICGPAGPKIDGVWTGKNAARDREADDEEST